LTPARETGILSELLLTEWYLDWSIDPSHLFESVGIMKLRVATFLTIAACALGLATSASALTISYTNIVDNGGSNYSAGTGGTFELSQFDTSLGTLSSVVLQITANAIGGHNRLDNESATDAGTVDLELGANVTVTGPASLLVLTLPHEDASGSITVDTDAGGADFVGTDYIGIASANATDVQTDSPDNFTGYTGTGNITFNFTSAGNLSVNLGAPLDLLDFFPDGIDQDNTDFNFTGIITYTYDSVEIPEPGAIAMMGLLGCLFVPFLRKVRRSTDRTDS